MGKLKQEIMDLNSKLRQEKIYLELTGQSAPLNGFAINFVEMKKQLKELNVQNDRLLKRYKKKLDECNEWKEKCEKMEVEQRELSDMSALIQGRAEMIGNLRNKERKDEKAMRKLESPTIKKLEEMRVADKL